MVPKGWMRTCWATGSATARDNSYLYARAPEAPAMPQQPVCSKLTWRSGSRTHTALAFGSQLDLEPSGFENIHRRDADVRLMITDERIVREHDAAARGRRRGGPRGKPMIKPMPGVVRQGPLAGQAQDFSNK